MQFTLRDLAWGVLCAALAMYALMHRNGDLWQQGHDVGVIQGEANARNRDVDYYMTGYEEAQRQFLSAGETLLDDWHVGCAMFTVRVQGQQHPWIMRIDRQADAQTEELWFHISRPDDGGFAGSFSLPELADKTPYNRFSLPTDSSVHGATHLADTREYQGETLYFWRNADAMLGMPGESDWLLQPGEHVDEAFARATAERDRQNGYTD